jgi:flagellar hook-associated protein 3 FlgL
MSSSLRALEQYRENLSQAQSRLSLEDKVLDQISNALTRAKELAVSQGGATASADTRAAVKEEVDELREFIIGLGNTQFTDSYLFGGAYADSRPFTTSGIDPTRPPEGDFQIEGGPGEFYSVAHSGQELLVDTRVLDALEELSTGLGDNDPEAIQASIFTIDSAFDGIQDLVADLGGRINRIDRAQEKLDTLELELRTQKSDLQETDMEETITKLVNRQVTYQSAMLANSRILNMTLTDYLR